MALLHDHLLADQPERARIQEAREAVELCRKTLATQGSLDKEEKNRLPQDVGLSLRMKLVLVLHVWAILWWLFALTFVIALSVVYSWVPCIVSLPLCRLCRVEGPNVN